jgi:hypothetical protein
MEQRLHCEIPPLEVRDAALPLRFGKQLGGRFYQTHTGVGNDELHAGQTAASSTLERTTAWTCPRSSAVSTRIASFSRSAVSFPMVASLWSGSWIASQLPSNQIGATASNVRNLCYVV